MEWEIKESFAEITINSWNEMVACLETTFLDWPEFIYRGQSDATWPLRSKFD